MFAKALLDTLRLITGVPVTTMIAGRFAHLPPASGFMPAICC